MESFTVTTTLDRDDWRALLNACGQRAQSRSRASPWVSRVVPQLPSIGIVLVLAVLYGTDSLGGLNTIVGAAALFVVYALTVSFVQRRMYEPDDKGAFVGESTFEFGPEGFRFSRAHSRTQMGWTLLRDVTRTPTHVFLWIDALSGYCIRVRDLPASMTAEEFEARLFAFRKAAAGESIVPAVGDAPSPSSGDGAPDAAGPVTIAPPRVIEELSALFRLLSFRNANPLSLVGRDLTIACLAIFNLLWWTGAQWIDARSETSGRVEFMWWSVPDLARYFIWILAIAWTLSRFTSPRLPVRQSLLLVLGFVPWLIVAWLFIGEMPNAWIFAVTIVLTVWAGKYFDSGARLMTGAGQYRAVTAAFAVALGTMWVGANYTFSSGLWHTPDEYEDSIDDRPRHEQLAFDQPARIDARVAAMASTTPGKPDVYFVGFAGFGDQRVFADEIAHAAGLVGDRFGSKNRQLLLINDRRDRETHPYATAPALRHALAKIGQRMDVEQDVLFLSLSSHGDSDATLSVSNEFDLWESLSGEALRKMLDESGIRWRVIVISACHSGSFIEYLKDERTIILTAAAKERTSFGCSDDRNMTYFGEAFYRDALPDATDLRTAFAAARESIAKREAREARTGSDPQSSFGPLLEAKLAALDSSAASGDGGR